MMKTKFCSQCKNFKNIILFYKNQRTCKSCQSLYQKQRIKISIDNNKHKNPYINKNKIKICPNCNQKKILKEFNKNRSNSDGLNSICRICQSICAKKSYKKNLHTITQKHKIYRDNNKEILKQKDKIRKSKNKEKISEQNKKYYMNNIEKIKENKKKRAKEISQYYSNRKKNDINFRISCNLRSRLYAAIKNNQKIGSAIKDLGCSIEFLKQYLASQFYSNKKTKKIMSWDNYGIEWEIDHIIPLMYFNLTKRKQFLKANHYTNLRPLWKDDHKTKTARDILNINRGKIK